VRREPSECRAPSEQRLYRTTNCSRSRDSHPSSVRVVMTSRAGMRTLRSRLDGPSDHDGRDGLSTTRVSCHSDPPAVERVEIESTGGEVQSLLHRCPAQAFNLHRPISPVFGFDVQFSDRLPGHCDGIFGRLTRHVAQFCDVAAIHVTAACGRGRCSTKRWQPREGVINNRQAWTRLRPRQARDLAPTMSNCASPTCLPRCTAADRVAPWL
jgi:hypothetical protein